MRLRDIPITAWIGIAGIALAAGGHQSHEHDRDHSRLRFAKAPGMAISAIRKSAERSANHSARSTASRRFPSLRTPPRKAAQVRWM